MFTNSVMKPDCLSYRLMYIFSALTLFVNPLVEAPKNIFIVLTLLAFVSYSIKNRNSEKYGLWDVFFGLFTLSYFIGLPFASQKTEIKDVTDIVRYMLFGWMIYRANFSEHKRIGLVFWAIFGTVIGLIYGAYSHYILLQGEYWTLNSVGHVNHAAIYTAIITGMALVTLLAYWEAFTVRQRSIWLLMFTLCFSYIVLGESRATFGAVLFFMSVLGILYARKNKKILYSIFGLIVIVIAVSVIGNVRIIAKQELNERNNNVLSSRDTIWAAGLDSAKQYPWFGVGKNNFRTVKIYGKGFEKNNSTSHAHNIYINTLVEVGIWGLLWQMALFVSIIWTMLRSVPNKAASAAHWANWGWCAAALSITLIVGLVNTTFHHEHAILAIFGFSLWLSFYPSLAKYRN